METAASALHCVAFHLGIRITSPFVLFLFMCCVFIWGYKSYPQMLCSYSCVGFHLGIWVISPDALFLFMCCVFIWGYESYPQMLCCYSCVAFHLGIRIISPDALFLFMCCVSSGDINHIPKCFVPIHVLCVHVGIQIISPDALLLFMCCVSSWDTDHIPRCFVPIHVFCLIWGYESHPQMLCSYSCVAFHLEIRIISLDALFLFMCCVSSGDTSRIPRWCVPIHVLCFTWGYKSYPQMHCSCACVVFYLGIAIISLDALFLFMCCVSFKTIFVYYVCIIPWSYPRRGDILLYSNFLPTGLLDFWIHFRHHMLVISGWLCFCMVPLWMPHPCQHCSSSRRYDGRGGLTPHAQQQPRFGCWGGVTPTRRSSSKVFQPWALGGVNPTHAQLQQGGVNPPRGQP